jgi:predicted amidohydrolase YtcJ
MNKRLVSFLYLSLLLILGCTSSSGPDLIVYNAFVYTAEDSSSEVRAFAIQNGQITAVGSDEEILKLKTNKTELYNAEGNFIMPGLIEGHGHFSYLGQGLLNIDFLRDTSWDQVVAKVAKVAENTPKGHWIEGRGWHQEKWNSNLIETVNGYPLHHKLSQAVPDHPVILIHASGHSLFANQKAMEIAGITAETKSPSGGEIVRDAKGSAIGVFEERAMNLIRDRHRDFLDTQDSTALLEKWYRGIQLAQELCLSYGITSFQDAGTRFDELDRYISMAQNNELQIRLYSMIRHDLVTLQANAHKLPVVNVGNSFFTCKAIKSELDGALGVFGAWKLQPYSDKPGFYGQNTTRIETLDSIADFALQKGMQLCVHAIGDRANRAFLDICEKKFSTIENHKALRWRSEHAQHLDTNDIRRFPDLGIIASMQGIHCTSDAPFVVKRLGIERSRTGAYAWRSLLDLGVIIANGTDAPVEPLNPFECLYASIARKRNPSSAAFFPEQAMSRDEALKSYTIACAYAAFEENQKGSIRKGKVADFIILDRNLLTCSEDEIAQTNVLKTYVNGILKYSRS